MSTRIRDRNIDIALTVALGMLIAVVTLMPAGALPQTPGGDKLHHFIAFAVFALPVSLRRPRSAWKIFLVALIFGGAIELIQPYVNRSRDIFDFRADALGAAFGMAIGLIISRLPRALAS